MTVSLEDTASTPADNDGPGRILRAMDRYCEPGTSHPVEANLLEDLDKLPSNSRFHQTVGNLENVLALFSGEGGMLLYWKELANLMEAAEAVGSLDGTRVSPSTF